MDEEEEEANTRRTGLAEGNFNACILPSRSVYRAVLSVVLGVRHVWFWVGVCGGAFLKWCGWPTDVGESERGRMCNQHIIEYPNIRKEAQWSCLVVRSSSVFSALLKHRMGLVPGCH